MVGIGVAELRDQGVRGLLIYCSDYKCSHLITMSGDRWPDDMRLSDIEPRFICSACGKRGADVLPDFNWNKWQSRRWSSDDVPASEPEPTIETRSPLGPSEKEEPMLLLLVFSNMVEGACDKLETGEPTVILLKAHARGDPVPLNTTTPLIDLAVFTVAPFRGQITILYAGR